MNGYADLMTRINSELASGDADTEVGVGQSYFIPTHSSSVAAEDEIQMKWKHQVWPLLREYAQLLNLGPDFTKRFPETLDDILTTP